jgi:hypothetical protein
MKLIESRLLGVSGSVVAAVICRLLPACVRSRLRLTRHRGCSSRSWSPPALSWWPRASTTRRCSLAGWTYFPRPPGRGDTGRGAASSVAPVASTRALPRRGRGCASVGASRRANLAKKRSHLYPLRTPCRCVDDHCYAYPTASAWVSRKHFAAWGSWLSVPLTTVLAGIAGGG